MQPILTSMQASFEMVSLSCTFSQAKIDYFGINLCQTERENYKLNLQDKKQILLFLANNLWQTEVVHQFLCQWTSWTMFPSKKMMPDTSVGQKKNIWDPMRNQISDLCISQCDVVTQSKQLEIVGELGNQRVRAVFRRNPSRQSKKSIVRLTLFVKQTCQGL